MSKIKSYFNRPGGKTIACLLIVLILFVVLDGIITEYLIDGGMAREANPFLEPLVGKAGFMTLKTVGALFCAFVLWDIHRRFPKMALITTILAVIVYGTIVIWNTSLFLLV